MIEVFLKDKVLKYLFLGLCEATEHRKDHTELKNKSSNSWMLSHGLYNPSETAHQPVDKSAYRLIGGFVNRAVLQARLQLYAQHFGQAQFSVVRHVMPQADAPVAQCGANSDAS